MSWLVVAKYELPDGALAAKMYFHPTTCTYNTKAEAMEAAAKIAKPPPRPVCSCCGELGHNIPYSEQYRITLDVEPETE